MFECRHIADSICFLKLFLFWSAVFAAAVFFRECCSCEKCFWECRFCDYWVFVCIWLYFRPCSHRGLNFSQSVFTDCLYELLILYELFMQLSGKGLILSTEQPNSANQNSIKQNLSNQNSSNRDSAQPDSRIMFSRRLMHSLKLMRRITQQLIRQQLIRICSSLFRVSLLLGGHILSRIRLRSLRQRRIRLRRIGMCRIGMCSLQGCLRNSLLSETGSDSLLRRRRLLKGIFLKQILMQQILLKLQIQTEILFCLKFADVLSQNSRFR